MKLAYNSQFVILHIWGDFMKSFASLFGRERLHIDTAYIHSMFDEYTWGPYDLEFIL